jgi:hypothetical protein
LADKLVSTQPLECHVAYFPPVSDGAAFCLPEPAEEIAESEKLGFAAANIGSVKSAIGRKE